MPKFLVRYCEMRTFQTEVEADDECDALAQARQFGDASTDHLVSTEYDYYEIHEQENPKP